MGDNIQIDDELDRIIEKLKNDRTDKNDLPNLVWRMQRKKEHRMNAGQYRCDQEAYRLLKQCSTAKNMEAWNQWRAANPNQKIYLQGADLRGAHCEGANFQDTHCEGADFGNSRCVGAIFEAAHCQGAIFEAAHCQEANFLDAHCEKADFSDADCKGAHFIFTHCENANFLDAHCEGAIFLYAHCEETKFWDAHCERAIFQNAHCEGADFENADCKRADFQGAHCEKANFEGAHCQRAIFYGANCEGAKFVSAYCEGTVFYGADFDGKSDFAGCFIDNKTDFRLSNIEIIKIEPGKRAMLERTIRLLYWEEWYKKIGRPKYQRVCRLIRRCWPPQFGWRTWRKRARVALLGIFTPKAQAARFFWWISDYGYSTERVLKAFGCSIFGFALLYTLIPGVLVDGAEKHLYSNFVDLISHFLQMLFFASATMMTLGFGNLNAAPGNLFGMFVVVANLMTGYFLLAVLVTRLAVLFQTMAPGYVVPKKPRPMPDLENSEKES